MIRGVSGQGEGLWFSPTMPKDMSDCCGFFLLVWPVPKRRISIVASKWMDYFRIGLRAILVRANHLTRVTSPQIQAVSVLSSLYPSLIFFSSFTFAGAPYRIFLLFLIWLPCHFYLIAITTTTWSRVFSLQVIKSKLIKWYNIFFYTIWATRNSTFGT